MIKIEDIYWPDTVGNDWAHALAHVGSLEWAMTACKHHRVAVQAGGNVGLWPRRMGQVFETVYTFEPEPSSRECLAANVSKNVIVSASALGDKIGTCDIKRRGLGSHRVLDGTSVPVTTIDALDLEHLDLLQLDVEGYEWHALMGGLLTIARCHPVVQVELRHFTEKYGHADADVTDMLKALGYECVTQRPGSDYVFTHRKVKAA